MSIAILLVSLLSQSSPEFAWRVTGDIRGVSDPTIISADGAYYIFCSGRGTPVRVSHDLHQWERIAPVFGELPRWVREKVPGATSFWAPDISFRDGRYWLYYSVSTLGSRRSVIGLATDTTLDSSAPDGTATWREEGDALQLRWPNPAAPDGAWIDTVRLSPDRSAYEGTNQNGIPLRGWQVASD